MLRDHLGSVSMLLNSSGIVLEQYSYDIWGKRRQSNWDDAVGQVYPTVATYLTRGFAEHEQMDDVGVVNMNGRIYDPVLGRVLSADPYVQFAGYSQSYNRYSYVLNNPLRFTDPSRYQVE